MGTHRGCDIAEIVVVQLNLSSGSATEISAQLRHEDWRCTVATLDGRLHQVQSGRHQDRDPQSVLMPLREAIRDAHRRYPDRLRAVSLAVAGTVRDDELAQASTLGWGPVDLSGLTAGTDLAFLVGNDATLAGVCEARTGAATGARTALHLTVKVGVGGALILGGLAVPLRAATRAEFDAAYAGGLMTFRRAQPPPVVDAAHGAAARGLDHITSEAALAAWSLRWT